MVYTITNLYANRTKNGGRRLPDVKHECYGKLSVKSFLNSLKDIVPLLETGIGTLISWLAMQPKIDI